MSMFHCFICGYIKDSDDGCDSTPNGLDLICIDCVDEAEDDEEE